VPTIASASTLSASALRDSRTTQLFASEAFVPMKRLEWRSRA